ncbi:MAG TPA: ribbon-helix-helix protein, CopG family [Casimicrobiaceae bacterium]|nr:ribbon-helix-helix protein, CopG family [Casimicrobiaceae bacterium]
MIMADTIRRTISLPVDLARETEAMARAQGKTFSEVVRDALRSARIERRRREFVEIQRYWSRKARERGILTEADFERMRDE